MRDTAAAWHRDGYLILRQVVPAARIEVLRELCDDARDLWHGVATEDSEPGGFAPGPREWVLMHLNHPRYHRQRPGSLAPLLDVIAQPLVLDLLDEIMAGRQLFAQANYYVEPVETKPTAWHRDCQFYGGDEDAVRQRVLDEATPPRELHVHIPLAPTANTELVPGSHCRWDTPEEHAIRTETPEVDEMPGAVSVELEPGDLAFFHVNSIHRGLYPGGVTRRTIAVSYGSTAYPRPATQELLDVWRGYVCTYQPWFLEPGYLDGTTPATRAFFERFIETYRDTWQADWVGSDWPEPRRRYFLPPYE